MRNFNNRGSKKYLFQSHYKQAGSNGFGRRKPLGRLEKKIDPSLFVNKAIPVEETSEFIPEHNFRDFKLDSRLTNVVLNRGYKTPTPIQDRTIISIANGLDVVGIADTGTGKTAAFLLPLIDRVLKYPRERVLIVVPTRELAIQIEDEFKSFSKGMRIFSVCCVGGLSIGKQISNLRYEYSFVIGTPGRLRDLIEKRSINLKDFNTVVLDEADRMFDMGFINDTRFIMNGLPKAHQTLFFSATVSREIEGFIREFTENPLRISVKTRDTSRNVEQDVVRIERGQNKLEVLYNLLKQEEFNKVIVFGKTKHGVERISRILGQNGLRVESIHGNKNNSQRQRALGLFKENRVQILVATDVAARGLDIPNVSHVINYDIPATYEDYVHRIGRTGRWKKRGVALTFIEA